MPEREFVFVALEMRDEYPSLIGVSKTQGGAKNLCDQRVRKVKPISVGVWEDQGVFTKNSLGLTQWDIKSCDRGVDWMTGDHHGWQMVEKRYLEETF